MLPDPVAAKCDLALLYLSCGHKNGPVNGSQRMRRALKAPEHPAAVDEYSHDRKSWAENLFQFA